VKKPPLDSGPNAPLRPVKVGLISDTHGYVHPQITGIFKGVAAILHGGDIGPYSVLEELGKIAPVTAVLGNNDLGLPLDDIKSVSIVGVTFLLHHIVNPHKLSDHLEAATQKHKPRVVLFGHSHKKFHEELAGILFINPGYSGKPRLGLPRSVAVLTIQGGKLDTDFFELV
jgi:putative phosphoesterase